MSKENGPDSIEHTQPKTAALIAAIEATERSFDDDAAWDAAEKASADESNAGPLAALYRKALKQAHSKSMAEKISKRAVSFFEEWFGDDPNSMKTILTEVISKDSDALWAFEKLTEMLTVRERWDDLFEAYDSLLSIETSEERRKILLEEASSIAKDIADNPTKALAYLVDLHHLDRTNFQRFRMIERMMERQESWKDLIALRQQQLPFMEDSDISNTCLQIADCYMSKLSNPQQAFSVLKEFLDAHPGDNTGCAELEKILADENTPFYLKLQTLDILTDNYDTANKPEEAVAAIETVIAFAEGDSKPSLHRRAGSRLAAMDRDEEAIAQYAALLLESPADADALKNLRILSLRAKRQDLRAAALVDAASACDDDTLKTTHLLDAGRIYADDLRDGASAIKILQSINAIEDIDSGTALTVAHKLNELYAQADLKEERLNILVRIFELERTHSLKRTVLVEAARLAEDLRDISKAMELWHRLLAESENDLEALSAVIDLTEQAEDYETLVKALAKRAVSSSLPEQRCADMSRAARVYHERLGQTSLAIDMWKAVVIEFGPRIEAVEALDKLLTEEKRYVELEALLEEASAADFESTANILFRLGELNLFVLDNPEKAFGFYYKVLVLNPADPRALDSIKQLILRPSTAVQAVNALVWAYRTLDDWENLLELTGHRLEVARSDEEQVEICLDAAKLQKTRAQNPEAARDLLTRALPLDPENRQIEAEMLRLAKAHGGWSRTGLALSQAASAVEDNPERRAHLKFIEGTILEKELDKPEGALAAYQETAAVEKRNPEILTSVTKLAAQLGKWKDSVTAAVSLFSLNDIIDKEITDHLKSCAVTRGEAAEMTAALEKEVQNRVQLRTNLRRQLDLFIADTYRTLCNNMQSAESAAARAVAAGSGHLDSLLLLADIRRASKSPMLTTTLKALYDLRDSDLDPLMEAAEVAEQSSSDLDFKREHFLYLYEAASKMWKMGRKPNGKHSREECCNFAAWQIAKLDESRGAFRQAAEMLLSCANLPFDSASTREMKRKAASLYAQNGMNGTAINIYMSVWQDNPEDVETLTDLNVVLAANDRLSDLMIVKKKLLDLTEDLQSRLTLRIEIAEIAGMLEGGQDRVYVLSANLSDNPGHKETIDKIDNILRGRRQYNELVELYVEQTKRLIANNSLERAAELMSRAAKIYEEHLRDLEKAIEAYEKVVELTQDTTAMDALSRLNASQNRWAQAASWLKAHLSAAKPQERVSLLLRLARIQLRLGQNETAVDLLEQAFEEAPKNQEIRSMLLEQYRSLENYEALAKTLSKAAAHMSSMSVMLSYTEEAADIYFYKLHVLKKAVSVLERAVELAPDEQRFRVMLAEALVSDEQYDRAETLLIELLESFGRRRSPERGAIHLQLALVAKAQGKTDSALEHLELAASMDTKNVATGLALAETARDIDDRDRAERAYRALLLLIRRESPKEGESPIIYQSEVLLELSFLAAKRDQADKASELLESAIEALAAEEKEILRITERLKARGDSALTIRVLEKAAELAISPSQRAKWLIMLSDCLAHTEEGKSRAFEIRLKAVAEDSGNPAHHDAAEVLAEQLDRHNDYISLIEELINKTRRENDELRRCELMLRLGNVHAKKKDLDAAWKCFEQAELLEVREVDVLKFGIKLAALKGDEKSQIRMLSALSGMGESVETETRADAMYRLAEIYLSSGDTSNEGVRLFEQAFSADPQCIRAGRILVRICKKDIPGPRLLNLFEKVARQSEDKALLLDYLEEKSNVPNVTALEIKEGAVLALDMKENTKADILMKKMLEARCETQEDRDAVLWAVLTSAELRKAEGDLEGAMKWLNDAAEISSPMQVFDLSLDIAASAVEDPQTLPLAIKIYKWLLEFDPGTPKVWKPLAEIYFAQNDLAGLEALAQETLYTIQSTSLRNELRLMHAKLLMSTDHRKSDALEVLMNIQMEEPDNAESLSMIITYYEDNGRTDDLADLLRDRYILAKNECRTEELKTISMALAPMIQDKDNEDAIEIYRSALALSPNDVELMERLLARLIGDEHQKERVQIREKMLWQRNDDTLASAALELVNEYRIIGDTDSAHRVLKSAYQRVSNDSSLESALKESFIATDDYRGLLELLQKTVSGISDSVEKTRIYREIADIAKNRLSDSVLEINALRHAREASPNDGTTIFSLLQALETTQKYEEAIEIATEALKQFKDDSDRCRLLNFRGNILRLSQDLTGAIEDLNEAFSINPKAVHKNLAVALEALLENLRIEGKIEDEQSVVLQLFEALEYARDIDKIRELLSDWLLRSPQDVSSWKKLLKLESDAENWDRVADICEQLIEIADGEDQVKAAIWLSQACVLSNRPDYARSGLETVYAKYPDNQELRVEMRNVYERAGDSAALARMLLQDAESALDTNERAKLLKKAGNGFMAAGDHETALEILTEALMLTPDDFETAIALIDTHIENNSLDAANELTDQSIAAQGGRRSAELSLLQQRKAQIMGAYGDQSQQLAWLEQAFVSNRNDGNVAAMLSNLAEEMEEWDLALKALRQITMLKEDTAISKAEAYFRQGKISYARDDDKKRALLFIKKALQENPDFEDARNFLDEVGEQ